MLQNKLIKSTAVVAILLTASTTAAVGQGIGGILGGLLGGMGPGGIPVHDGIGQLERILQTTKLVAQLQQLVQTYNHLKYQAQRIANLGRYRSPSVVWRGMTTSNLSGKTGQWVNAVNSGANTFGAWETATTDLATYPNLNLVPSSQQDRKMTEFASIELADGTAVSAIDTIGRVRAAGPHLEQIVNFLQEDSLANDPDMHTEAAQLNKANAIALIQTKALADMNKLAVSTAEIALIQLREQREAAAYALANDVAFRTQGKAALEAQQTGASDAMRNFRLP